MNHLANKSQNPNESDKDPKVLVAELKKTIDKTLSEKNELLVKLEESILAHHKSSEQVKYLKIQNADLNRINALLCRACVIYGKRWRQIASHFSYFQEFYNNFSKYMEKQGCDTNALAREIKELKQGFKTERNYNTETLIDTKAYYDRELSADRHLTLPPKSHEYNGTYNLELTEENEPLKNSAIKRTQMSDLKPKDIIMRIARDVYTNRQISSLVPDPQELLEQNRSRDRLQLKQIYKEK